jgi:hypothetical protein
MNRSPSEDEAAAAIAAVERFLAETAPQPAEAGQAVGPWQRAALLEGVAAKEVVPDGQGGERWLS